LFVTITCFVNAQLNLLWAIVWKFGKVIFEMSINIMRHCANLNQVFFALLSMFFSSNTFTLIYFNCMRYKLELLYCMHLLMYSSQ
jgi:hypothetical protein